MCPILWVWTNIPSLHYFHCYKNPVYSACSYLSLATTNLFTDSVVLLLMGYHIVGIIQYVTFSDWLLSFNNMHVSSLHTFLRLENSFLFSTELIPCLHILQCIHLPTTERHLDCLCNVLYFFKGIFLIFGCAGSLLPHGLFSIENGGYSLVVVRRLLIAMVSLVAQHGLKGTQASAIVVCGLSSCSFQAQLLRSMWDPSGSGIKLVSPALAGGFFTTEPPGKP